MSDCGILSRPRLDLPFNTFFEGILAAGCLTDETADYKWAVMAVDGDMKPLTFWFANAV